MYNKIVFIAIALGIIILFVPIIPKGGGMFSVSFDMVSVADLITSGIESGSKKRKMEYLRSLEDSHNKEADDILMSHVTNDQRAMIKSTAIMILGRRKSREAVDLILDEMNRTNFYIVFSRSIYALGNIGDDKSLEYLNKCLNIGHNSTSDSMNSKCKMRMAKKEILKAIRKINEANKKEHPVEN